MPVSHREFFETPNWKQKRYNNLIFQAGKNPGDFELVELQDMLNYESQQFMSDITQNGFIGDGFKVFEDSVPGVTAVRIHKGRGWVQASEPITGGQEFSGVRLELPDILTGITEEHAVTGDYHTFAFTAGSPTLTRYDLIFVKFYRKEYVPGAPLPGQGQDPEMQSPVLGETATREKWYYEFVYQIGTGSDTNPQVTGLGVDEHAVRLAIVVRDNGNPITNGTVIDVRPKLSFSPNVQGATVVTVGEGGNYNTIYDVLDNPTGVNPITPSASNPYLIKLLPGVHACHTPLNIGSTSYINIQGAGSGITILEFSDIYSMMSSGIPWIAVASAKNLTFSNLTVRIADPRPGTYTVDNWLIDINGSASGASVYFESCQIGDLFTAPNTSMSFGGINVLNANLNFHECTIKSRSVTKASFNTSGTSNATMIASAIYQSGGTGVSINTGYSGTCVLISSGIFANAEVIRLNGIGNINNCQTQKVNWTGDAVTSDDAVSILAPTLINVLIMTGDGTPGHNHLYLGSSCDCISVSNDDAVVNDIAGTVRLYTCILNAVTTSNNSTFKLRSSSVVTFTITSNAHPTINGGNITTLNCGGTASVAVRSCIIDAINLTSTGTDEMEFIACLLGTVVSSASFVEFNACEFEATAGTTVTLTSSPALFMDCHFHEDGRCIDATDSAFEVHACRFSVTTAVHVIQHDGTANAIIKGCFFYLGNASAIAVFCNVATATCDILGITFMGNATALGVDATAMTNVGAAHISGNINTYFNAANVTIVAKEYVVAGTDEKVKVDVADTTAGYLNGKLVAGTNVTLVPSGVNKVLTINASTGGGEANTASNLGGGFGWFKSKVLLDLQFKSVTATSTKISLANNVNDIGIDVAETNLTLSNMIGPLSIAKGGTGLSALGSANQILGMNAIPSALEYKSILGTAGLLTVTPGVGSITLNVGANVVQTIRSISTSSPLSGGGDLSADRTITLGTVGIGNGGTGQTTKVSAFDALAPGTTKGDLIVFNGTTISNVRIGLGTIGQVIKSLGAGGTEPGLAWATLTSTDVGLGNVTNDAQVKLSTITTLGDLILGTGAGAVTVVGTGGVGNNGFVLMADTTVTGGVKWVIPPTGTITTSTLTNLTGILRGNGANIVTPTQVSLTADITGTLAIGNGGTGQTTANPAFNALAPTSAKGDLITFNGTTSLNIRLANGTAGQVLTADPAGAEPGIKWANVVRSPMSFSWAQNTNPYVTSSVPASPTTNTVAQIAFPGTSAIGIPLTFRVNIWGNNSNGFTLEIYDVTNATSLGTSSSITSISSTNVATITLSGVNSASAVWELRVTRVGGTVYSILAAGSLMF